MSEPTNSQRVLLYLADKTESKPAINNTNGLVIQRFGYESKREHHAEVGKTYHLEDATIIHFSIRVNKPADVKPLQDHMNQPDKYTYTFLFNPNFQSADTYTYDDAMMVSGYIVDMEMEYVKQTTDEKIQEQILLHVKLLLNTITFFGENNNILELEV